MNDDRMDELDKKLTAALERAPAISVPVDFPARVAAKVSVARDVRLPVVAARNIGFRVAVGIAGVLLLALFVVAARDGLGKSGMWVEVGVALEFAGLTTWLGLRTLWARSD